MKRIGILFVCTHNICRSPLAEASLRAKVTRAGVADHVVVASAGTNASQAGQLVDPRAVAVAERRGYELHARKARRVTLRDFDRFGRMFAMDDGNLRLLAAMRPPGYEGHVGLILDLAPSPRVREIPDPYYGSLASFEHVLDLLEPALDALVRDLAVSLRSKAS